jgi:hypothetical protein
MDDVGGVCVLESQSKQVLHYGGSDSLWSVLPQLPDSEQHRSLLAVTFSCPWELEHQALLYRNLEIDVLERALDHKRGTGTRAGRAPNYPALLLQRHGSTNPGSSGPAGKAEEDA